MRTAIPLASLETVDQLVLSLSQFGATTAFRQRTEFRTFSWTYSRISTDALGMAVFLQRQGLHPGDKLIIWALNGPQWGSIFLGCILSGVVAVPLDLRFSETFVRDVGKEVEARLVFRTRYKPDPGLGASQFFTEDLYKLLVEVDPGQYRPPSIGPNTMMEIIYTSGTVARPKGVILTHQNIVSELRVLEPVLPPESEYRFLSLLPLSHILEQMAGLFVPLSRGATVVYLDTLKPSSILEALQQEHITDIVLVPRLLQLLRNRLQREVDERKLLRPLFPRLLASSSTLPPAARRLLFWPIRRQLGGTLKHIVSGGAALDPEVEGFWDNLGIIVLQGYGLTETASAVTCNRLGARRIGSVGQVLANQEARIAPDGEILVSGLNVTPGYHANERENAAAFEDGWLKTGDMGVFDSEGFLFIKGRKKDVIVTSAGLNIYPEDIEGVLNHLPGVREASVIEWRGTVHAVLLLDRAADPRSVVEQANRELDPSQQIQGFTVWPFEDFPRTPTLKARKRDLLDFLRRQEAGKEFPPPPIGRMTRLHQLIARVSPVGPTAIRPEATLGLDLKLGSIDRLELVSLIEQELGIDLPDELVTAETTVAQLDRALAERPRRVKRLSFPVWSLNPLTATVRELAQQLLLFPLLGLLLHTTVDGIGNLKLVSGPVIFASNHQSYLDAPAILMSMPRVWRHRLAVAAWLEYFEASGKPWPERALRRFLYYLAIVLTNIFPLPQQRLFRESIKYTGRLVDHNWSILIFPEGQRTTTGEMLPFREGIGLLASLLQVPVIPVGLTGLYAIYGPSKILPTAGNVRVRFGKPLHFRDESYIEITKRIESAVKDLVEGSTNRVR